MSSDERINPWKISSFKPGMSLLCKVSHSEPGGYTVLIIEDDLPAFLPIEETLQIGEEVTAYFVCIYQNRIMLSAGFSKPEPPDRAPDVCSEHD